MFQKSVKYNKTCKVLVIIIIVFIYIYLYRNLNDLHINQESFGREDFSNFEDDRPVTNFVGDFSYIESLNRTTK